MCVWSTFARVQTASRFCLQIHIRAGGDNGSVPIKVSSDTLFTIARVIFRLDIRQDGAHRLARLPNQSINDVQLEYYLLEAEMILPSNNGYCTRKSRMETVISSAVVNSSRVNQRRNAL